MEEDSDDTVYGESREDLVESDEISPEEEGFMRGYDDADETDEKNKEKDEDDEDDEDEDDEEQE
jgi:hypothetical protein